MKSKELREKRCEIAKQMEKVVLTAKGENRPLNSEEQAAFDKMHNDCNQFLTEAEGYERIEKFEKLKLDELNHENKGNKPQANSIEQYRQADADKGLRGWMASKFGKHLSGVAADNKHTADKYGYDYNKDRVSLTFANQSSVVAGVGADFVPTTLANFIYRELLPISNIRQTANILRTATGETHKIPVNSDTFEAVLLAQNATDAQQEITTDEKTLLSHMYSTRRVNVPVEWLRDSAFPVEQFVGEEFGRRYARGTNRALCQGAGTTEPQGYNKATVGGNVVDDLDYTDMVSLYYGIPAPYREAPSFAWRVSDAALKTLRQEVDGVGRPIWQPSVIAGQPDLYMGKAIYSDPYLGDFGSIGNVVVVGGDWSRFLVREVGNFEVWSLNVIDNRQVALVGFGAIDSLLLSTTALQCLKVAAS